MNTVQSSNTVLITVCMHRRSGVGKDVICKHGGQFEAQRLQGWSFYHLRQKVPGSCCSGEKGAAINNYFTIQPSFTFQRLKS